MAIQKTDLADIYNPVQQHLSQVQGEIFSILTTSNKLIGQIVKYFYSGTGKLLRPSLCLLGASLGKPNWEEAVRIAATWEIFHSASLIHDDIIDGSFLRRNIPTVPVKWGPQASVLVGDYMHNRAIDTVYSTRNDQIISLFINITAAVCDGEIEEVYENNNFDLTEESYFSIIEKKTATLLGASIKSGAILGKLSAEETSALYNYGLYFGIAFQIVDDCLDFEGNENDLGKIPGGDAESGVLTLPLIRLLNLVPATKKSEVFQSFKSVSSGEKLEYLTRLMEEYDTLTYAHEKAQEYADKARLELSTFPESPSKQSLLDLLDFVLVRNR
jgi:octaprenyl-diphosphate synthase